MVENNSGGAEKLDARRKKDDAHNADHDQILDVIGTAVHDLDGGVDERADPQDSQDDGEDLFGVHFYLIES